MNKTEFIDFYGEKPEKNKHVIVTNNINAVNSHGEMSHVWLVDFFGESLTDGVVIFDDNDLKITNLTHWKYA